jgi:predicted ATPase
MISKIRIGSFKSLEDVEFELGLLNVFIGANGSGKSNLLEAIGVLSAAADGKVNDQTLLQRGVRPGVPKLYKSAFPIAKGSRQLSHIFFSASSQSAHYDVSLNNPLNDPSPSWKFKTELLECDDKKLSSRGPNLKDNPNTDNGLAALKIVELKEGDPALELMRRLQGYVIYTPTTPVLRGVAPEVQPRQPLGLSGGRLPESVKEVLHHNSHYDKNNRVIRDALELIDWAKSLGAAASNSIPLSPSASNSPIILRFKDKFMKEGANILSGYDASEGALYVLFLMVIALHQNSPNFCAIDNADHGLNPGLVKALFGKFAKWIVENSNRKQVLITSHNPALLDGLPLQDDRVRLFTVDRDNNGKTVVKRIVVDKILLDYAQQGWTLSRLWMNGLLGGMPNV